MRSSIPCRLAALGLATLLFAAGSSSIVGQVPPQPVALWQFDGDFSAVLGEPIDSSGNMDMSFGKCSDWDLPLINGSDESIIRLGRHELPNADAFLKLHTGLSASGSGERANDFTLVMDILFTAPHGDGDWTSILNLDGANGEVQNLWYGAPRGRSGVSRINSGFRSTPDGESIPENEWHRLAFRVRTNGERLTEEIFINGVKKSIPTRDLSLVDGRNSAPSTHSDHPWIALWGQPYTASNAQGTGYINSFAIYDGALGDKQIELLGAPSSGGIPSPREEEHSVRLTFRGPVDPVFVPLKSELISIVPGEGAPYYATHDFSEAIIPHGNDVYYAWFGNGSHIAMFDGNTGQWSEPITLGGISLDQYRYPDMIIDREGYIHVFYGGHGWFSREGDPFSYRRSVRPRDISEWTPERTIGWQCAFPRPIILEDGRILLLHRGSRKVGNEYTDHGWGYIESRDNGETWLPFVRLVAENYVLYGGGEVVEKPGKTPRIHWAWCWWDENVCDLGTYYSPNPMVPCKYDHVVYAEFPLDDSVYADAVGETRPLPLKEVDIQPVWTREFLSVADLAMDAEGRPVALFSDYEDRLHPRMLIATRQPDLSWVVEEPLPGIPVATNNMRLRTAGPWTVIVAWALGDEPGVVVAQRKGSEGPFFVRQIRHQQFPYTMHPTFMEDMENERLHIFWAEGDRIGPSRLMYGALPLEP